MSDQHTPGPWIGGRLIRTADENGITTRKIATAYGPFADAETAANARLIAAAPELLEAGEQTLALIGFLHEEVPVNAPILKSEAVFKLRAAIAKARGQ